MWCEIFSFWETLKDTVNTTQLNSSEDHGNKILAACQTIFSEIIENVDESLGLPPSFDWNFNDFVIKDVSFLLGSSTWVRKMR